MFGIYLDNNLLYHARYRNRIGCKLSVFSDTVKDEHSFIFFVADTYADYLILFFQIGI